MVPASAGSEEGPLLLEDKLCRWFPTTISKLLLAISIVALAALIMPS
jgi:hypothetical protein